MADIPREQRAAVKNSFQDLIELFRTGERKVEFTYFAKPYTHTMYGEKPVRDENGNLVMNVNIVQTMETVTSGSVRAYRKERISQSFSKKPDRFFTYFYIEEEDWDDRPYSTKSWTNTYELAYDHETEIWYLLLPEEKLARITPAELEREAALAK